MTETWDQSRHTESEKEKEREREGRQSASDRNMGSKNRETA